MGKDKEKELEQRAYRLGFEVGLHSHDEWTSWVWKEKKEIFNEAIESSILDRVESAYERGKFDGFSRRKKIKEGKISRSHKIHVIGKPTLITKPAVTDIVKTILIPKFLKFFK